MSGPDDTYLIADLRAALRSVTADRDAARAEAARYRDALERIQAEPRITQWVCDTACHQSGGPHTGHCRHIDKIGDICAEVLRGAGS